MGAVVDPAERVISRPDRGRVLRECAVDLIRASDLVDGSLAATESAHRRLRRVQRDLMELEHDVATRVKLLQKTEHMPARA